MELQEYYFLIHNIKVKELLIMREILVLLNFICYRIRNLKNVMTLLELIEYLMIGMVEKGLILNYSYIYIYIYFLYIFNCNKIISIGGLVPPHV